MVSQIVVLSIFISFGVFLSLGVGVMEESYFRAVSAAGLFALLLYLQVMWSLASGGGCGGIQVGIWRPDSKLAFGLWNETQRRCVVFDGAVWGFEFDFGFV